MIGFDLDGKDVSVDVPDGTTLLSVLSDHLHIAGPKYGCGKGKCGACSVLVDGRARAAKGTTRPPPARCSTPSALG